MWILCILVIILCGLFIRFVIAYLKLKYMVFKWPYSNWPSKSNQSRLSWKSTNMSSVPFSFKKCFKYFICRPGIIFQIVLVAQQPNWHCFIGSGIACLVRVTLMKSSNLCIWENMKTTGVQYLYKLLIRVDYAKWLLGSQYMTKGMLV